MSTVLTAVAGIVLVMLAAAALLTVRRIFFGPTNLDRIIAMDVLLAVIIAGLGVQAAMTRQSTSLPLLMILGLVAFVGGVAVTRMVAHDRDTDRPS